MFELADISQFKTLMNGSVAVQNSILSRAADWVRGANKGVEETDRRKSRVGGMVRSLKKAARRAAPGVALACAALGSAYDMTHKQPPAKPLGQQNTPGRELRVNPKQNPLDELYYMLSQNMLDSEKFADPAGLIRLKTGELGQKLAAKAIFKTDPKEYSDNVNYVAAMNRCARCIREQNPDPQTKNALIKGFDRFGRFCANLNIDLSRDINDVNIVLGVKRNSSQYIDETHTVEINDESLHDYATIFHELQHMLDYRSPAVRNIKRKPGLFSAIYKDDRNPGAVKVSDVTRGLVAGNRYSGVVYTGPGGFKDNPAYYPFATAVSRKQRLNMDEERYGDEFWSSFASQYGWGEEVDPELSPSLLYTLAVMRQMRQVNQEAERLGIAYKERKDLQSRLIKTAKRTLVTGAVNKIPMAKLTKLIGMKLHSMAEAYLDNFENRQYGRIELD